MTNEQRRENWEQFAIATDHLLEHPDISDKLLGALHGFIDSMLPGESLSEHCSRRLLAYGEYLAKPPRERRAHKDTVDNWFSDLGAALGAIVADDETPDHVRSAVSLLNTEMDEWAGNVDELARQSAIARMLLPELLIIANDEVESPDEPTGAAAAPETKPTWPKDEPRPTPTTEAEMLIEIGRLREQLIAARKSEWAAHQAYRELEQFHGGGPVQVTFDDDGDDGESNEQAAAAQAP